jgi:hypothetical protein
MGVAVNVPDVGDACLMLAKSAQIRLFPNSDLTVFPRISGHATPLDGEASENRMAPPRPRRRAASGYHLRKTAPNITASVVMFGEDRLLQALPFCLLTNRARMLAALTHFLEIDLLRGSDNPLRRHFADLAPTSYFLFVARKTAIGRTEEGYPLRLQDELPAVGLPHWG